MKPTLLITLTVLAPALAHAGDQDVLSQPALFNRCYMHMTQRKPARNNPLMQAVVAGTKTAVDACMELFDKAALQTSSQGSEGSLVSDTPEGRYVLQTFNDFHRSWFPNDSIAASTPNGVETNYTTALMHDESEGGLNVTRILFTPNTNYAELVTLDTAVEGVRSNGFLMAPANTLIHAPSASSSAPASFNVELVSTGELTGVRKMTAARAGRWSYTFEGPYKYEAANQKIQVFVNQSLGGGILGSRAYLMLNLGRPDYEASDGGIRMNRRWAKAFAKDLLCRDLPVIRLTDAAPYVQGAGANRPPFRAGTSCMQCHAFMDQAAATIRNVHYVAIPDHYGPAQATVQTYVIPSTLSPQLASPVNYNANYGKYNPEGKFLFRGYDGTLYNDDVTATTIGTSVPTGLAMRSGTIKLGEKIAATNDLYACAAARYFKFFTGVQVSLQDIGDPTTALSAGDIAYRDLVIQAGINLKANPTNLRALIQSIISSPLYGKASMRLPAP